MKKKVIIRIKDMSSEHCPELIFSVDLSGSTYGGASPCANGEDVKKAIKHFKEWAIKEGDIPVIKDERARAKLSAFW